MSILCAFVVQRRRLRESKQDRLIPGQYNAQEPVGKDMVGKKRDRYEKTDDKRFTTMPDMSGAKADVEEWKLWAQSTIKEMEARIRNGDELHTIIYTMKAGSLDPTRQKHRTMLTGEAGEYSDARGLLRLIEEEVKGIISKRGKEKQRERNRVLNMTAFTGEGMGQAYERYETQLKKTIEAGAELQEQETTDALKTMFEQRNAEWSALRETAVTYALKKGRRHDQLYLSDFKEAVEIKYRDEDNENTVSHYEDMQTAIWQQGESSMADARSAAANVTSNGIYWAGQYTGGNQPYERRNYVREYDTRYSETGRPRSRFPSPGGQRIEQRTWTPRGTRWYVKAYPRNQGGNFTKEIGERINYSNDGSRVGYETLQQQRKDGKFDPWHKIEGKERTTNPRHQSRGRSRTPRTESGGRRRMRSPFPDGTCKHCGSKEHKTHECKNPVCFNCGKTGHQARECPDLQCTETSPAAGGLSAKQFVKGVKVNGDKISYTARSGRNYAIKNAKGFVTPRLGNTQLTPERKHVMLADGARGQELPEDYWQGLDEVKPVQDFVATTGN